jgi:ADP-heptose:LPS heptosyltransferase
LRHPVPLGVLAPARTRCISACCSCESVGPWIGRRPQPAPRDRLRRRRGERQRDGAEEAAAAGAASDPHTPPALDGAIERIVVFRALMLGDLLCAVPALRALRRGFPPREHHAGRPGVGARARRAAELRRPLHRVPGASRPAEVAVRRARAAGLLAQVQAQRFDLALQLHGSGPIVNPLVATFGARHSAGFFNAAAWRPDEDAAYYAPWPERGHEILRMLRADRLARPAARRHHLEFPVLRADREALRTLWPGRAGAASYVCIHAGAQLPSRRWPIERFAEVANRSPQRARRSC